MYAFIAHVARTTYAATHVDTQAEIVASDIAIFLRREESHNYGRPLEISRLPRPSHIHAGSVIAR